MAVKKTKLPKDFKWLFWGYDFKSINPFKNKRLIIVNTLNYGNLRQWKWLVRMYGRKNLQEIIKLIPESEFRKQVVKLIKLLFGIKKFKYASRSAQIRAEKGFY